MKPLLRIVLAVALGSLALGIPLAAVAAEEGAPHGASLEHLLSILVGVVLALGFAVGVGCALALLRVMLPALARSADRSLAALGTGRLFVSGLLPLIGALLVTWALAKSSLPPALSLILWLPLLLLAVAGAMAALPHLGAQVLKAGSASSLLARSAIGGLVAGLSMATWLLAPLGLVVSLLLGGWVLGVGLGLLVRPAPLDSSPAA